VESYNEAYDKTVVQISTDGGVTWSDVWYRDARNPSEAAWVNSGDISLAAYDGATNALLRFYFDSVDGLYNNYAGWFIDDVQVSNLGDVTRKYYYAGGQRVAMRENNTLYWLLTDHLGSTAKVASGSTPYGELRYKAWGETRYTWGTTPTTYRFTGQREESTIGLYFYNARWYDRALGRFVQADSLVQADAKNPTPYLLLAVTYANPKILEQWNQLQRARLSSEAQTD
jgi:RHS repeat-associated protein